MPGALGAIDTRSTWNMGARSASSSASGSASGSDALNRAPAPASTGDLWGDRSRLPALHEVVRVVGIGRLVIEVWRGRVLQWQWRLKDESEVSWWLWWWL
jgi:hypothetical protein